MTKDLCDQDFFIYVFDQEDGSKLLPLLDATQLQDNDSRCVVIDESWVKIPLQDELVVYARLGNDASD